MNNKKRLIITSLVVSGALLVASITTTVAWFAGSPYLEYNNISIGITDKNIEISPDNVNWYPTLDNDNLETVETFKPVTSMYSQDWIAAKEETPEFRRGYGKATKQFMNDKSDCDYARTGFFSQDVYIKSDTDTYLTVDPEKTFFKADEAKNEGVAESLKSHYPDLTKDEILDNLNSIQKSLRMSLLILNNENSDSLDDYNYYVIEPYKDKDTLFAGIMDNDEDHYYDNVNGYETVYGDVSNEEKAVYDEPLEQDSEIVGESSIFNASTKAGVHHFNLEKSIENGLEIAKENSIALEDAGDKIYVPLSANTSRKMVVSLYLEGWDQDNTNVTMFANFKINVSFMIATSRSN